MEAYIYQADMFCKDCGKVIKRQLAADGKAPDFPDDETTYDSDEFPKGPYDDGGGESDTPHNCAQCGKFLENPLTEDGYNYVKAQIEDDELRLNHENKVLLAWKDFYGEDL